jgi:hypothetical protein
MKNILRSMAVLFACVLFLSCNKYLGDPTNSYTYDADAQKFMDSCGITVLTEKFAINNLVKQLKDSSLWAKFVAVYPMMGGTATTAKWNLMDPRDLDAAYRLTFYGTPVCAATGVLFTTANDYADTHLADSAIGGYNNSSIAYYSRTQNTISGYDIGCTDAAVPYNELSVFSNSADNSEWFGFSQNMTTANTTGLFMLSSSATNVTRYRNGAVVSSKGSAPNSRYTNLAILIGKSRVTTHTGQKECALATIGNGLTGAQALTFYNIVQNFETALDR